MSLHKAVASVFEAISQLTATGWPIPDAVSVLTSRTVELSFHDCPEPIDDWVTLFAPGAQGDTHLLTVDDRRVESTRWTGDWFGHPVTVCRYTELKPRNRRRSASSVLVQGGRK